MRGLRLPIGRKPLLIAIGGVFLVVALGAVAARKHLWLAHSAAQPSDGVNVLLISLDTTRKDHLSCYGYERNTTPHLDAVADEGLRFTRCVATSNWTLPSHASMLSGLYPSTHGAHWVSPDKAHVNPKSPAAPMSTECRTLAEVLRGAGYRTGAIVANRPYLNRAYRLDRGFDYYDDRASTPPDPYRQASEITGEVIRWLERSGPEPFFLFLNYLDPHVPFNPPPPYNTRFSSARGADSPANRSWGMHFYLDVRDQVNLHKRSLSGQIRAIFHTPYDGEIAFMDAQIGRVLQWLREEGRYDQTLIVITSDHGESFGEHEVMGHGMSLYEPEVAVPLIIKLPGRSEKRLVDDPVQHVDLMPTILKVLDLPVPDGVQGQSALRPSNRDLFVEEYFATQVARRWPRFNQHQWAVYRGNMKYIAYADGRSELFDLASDPRELDDLSDQRPQSVQELQAALDAWRSAMQPLPTAPANPDPEQQDLAEQQLRNLGYVQ